MTAPAARPGLLKPPRLRPGDTIGLLCPASAPATPERVQAGAAALAARGHPVKLGRHVLARHGAFAGTDAQRAEDLNRMLNDPEVRMIVAVRGGYGCPRILADVDYDAVRRDPKIVVGYSDLTALQLALFARTGLVTFSGPMAGVEFRQGPDPFTAEHFWRLVTDPAPPGALPNPDDEPRATLVDGVGEGPLLGGCLALLASCLGTPYLPDLRGAVLALEDIHEHLHRVDRLLTQLRHAGILGSLAGLALGHFTDCGPAEPSQPWLDLPAILDEVVRPAGVPTLTGLAYGHVPRKLTLPWGVRTRLDATARRLELLEGAVA